MAITWTKLAYEDDVITKAVLTTEGDIIYASGADTPARLGIGSNDDVLTLAAGIPSWAAPAASAAHKDLHDPEDGSDKLDTAAPAELAGVQASGVGSSHSFARADHAHQIQESMADDHIVTVNDADAADGEVLHFTATGGVEGKTPALLAASMALDDIGVPDAAVDFDLQQATDLVFMTVANEAALPAANVSVGQPCFATAELTLHVCTASV